MSGGPKPPDPKKTAQQQTQSNINTAIAGTTLNNPNQFGPLGSITRQQTGTQNIGGVDVPTFDVTSSLNPQTQSIVDALLGNAGDFASGQGATGRQGFLDTLRELQAPELDRQRAALEQRLATQGILPGSEAFNREIELSNQGANDADLRSILQAGNFAGQEINQGLNNPIAQALGLVSGAQPGIPQATQGVANTDVAGITNQAFQQQQAQNNALLGGIGGIAGTGLGFLAGGPVGAQIGGSLGGSASGLFGL